MSKSANSTTQEIQQEKYQIPKPKTARILWKIRSRHPLSVFSTTVAFPYLYQEQIKPTLTNQTKTKTKLPQNQYQSTTHLSSSGTSVCVSLTTVTPASGSSNTSLTCKYTTQIITLSHCHSC